MKKILTIFVILSFLGCGGSGLYNDGSIGKGINGTSVYTFSYKGHKYLQFGAGELAWGTHDPDCQCFKK